MQRTKAGRGNRRLSGERGRASLSSRGLHKTEGATMRISGEEQATQKEKQVQRP